MPTNIAAEDRLREALPLIDQAEVTIGQIRTIVEEVRDRLTVDGGNDEAAGNLGSIGLDGLLDDTRVYIDATLREVGPRDPLGRVK